MKALTYFAQKACGKATGLKLLAGVAVTALALAAPGAHAQQWGVGVEIGGPRYVAPAPAYGYAAPAYGYAAQGYGYAAPAYGYGHGYWQERRAEEWRAEQWREHEAREHAWREHEAWEHRDGYRGYPY